MAVVQLVNIRCAMIDVTALLLAKQSNPKGGSPPTNWRQLMDPIPIAYT